MEQKCSVMKKGKKQQQDNLLIPMSMTNEADIFIMTTGFCVELDQGR